MENIAIRTAQMTGMHTIPAEYPGARRWKATRTIPAEYRAAHRQTAIRTIPVEYRVVRRLEITIMGEVTKAVEIAEIVETAGDITSLGMEAVIIEGQVPEISL